ncbi:50S ribosomal protein L18 [Candidatus Marinamargulisbacteria bacterium SCGC AG-333-B06]|nr:50S ribosomal protein L18 [Candidatus Marinamargulisbacteria bacterium SCGC AG-333-B06]
MSKNKRKLSKRISRLTSNKYRLSVKRSNLHIYAQIIDDQQNKTLVAASSLKIDQKTGLDQAKEVGIDIAKKAVAKKIDKVYLDRGKLRYAGRLKMLCEAARDNGLIF